MTDEPEIQVDSDWKAEAQAEKEKLSAEAETAAEEHSQKRQALPPADFKGLMGLLASQAIMGLGAVQDREGRGVMVDLEGARFAIDLLVVLQEKTKGNLEEEEQKELDTIIPELQSRFVQISELVAQQAAAGVDPKPGESLKIPGMPEA